LKAEEEGLVIPDLASTLYNPDGSVRGDVVKEAKERIIQFSWTVDESTQGRTQVDANTKLTAGSSPSGPVQISYKVPEKWISTDKGMYIDPSEGVNAKAADHIYVYQAPGFVSPKDLDRAGTIGVGKALQVQLLPELERINTADLVSGHKAVKEDGQLYYEFDMASAPKVCENSKENLGLGFCPFDRIYLLSATLSNDGRLYFLCIECDNLEWKQANADLKRVRASFRVTTSA
jgi:hypothetical protein